MVRGEPELVVGQPVAVNAGAGLRSESGEDAPAEDRLAARRQGDQAVLLRGFVTRGLAASGCVATRPTSIPRITALTIRRMLRLRSEWMSFSPGKERATSFLLLLARAGRPRRRDRGGRGSAPRLVPVGRGGREPRAGRSSSRRSPSSQPPDVAPAAWRLYPSNRGWLWRCRDLSREPMLSRTRRRRCGLPPRSWASRSIAASRSRFS